MAVKETIKIVTIQALGLGARRVVFALFVLFMLGSVFGVSALAQPIAVRSDFITELTLPGLTDHFQRPGRVVYDETASEIYVADQGNNRIVIFDSDGAYRFEFNLAGRVGSIVDFAVSPEGFIYVLGSTQDGRKLLTYDFDGIYVGEFMADVLADMDVDLTSVATDSENRIYLLDSDAPQVLVLNSAGDLTASIPVLDKLSDAAATELVLGTLTTTEDGFLLPASSLGMVYHYTLSGDHIKTYGYKGTTTGELAFPVSAAIMSSGLVVVLDKQRFAVLCFTPDGKCLGEFGGKGRIPGWFYFPSYLAVDETDRTIISQVFRNRVQICRIPEAIEERLTPATSSDGGGSANSQIHDKTEHSDLVGHLQHTSHEGGL